MLNAHRCLRLGSLILVLTLCPRFSFAEQRRFDLDPKQSKIDFSIRATLHTVTGSFRLKRGSIQFDDTTGQAAGELVVDALSGDTGNKTRNGRMHRESLESSRFTEIVFIPRRIRGTVAAEGTSNFDIEGLLRLHGQSLPVTAAMVVELVHGAGSAETVFFVNYPRWGVKNPSLLLLNVSDDVEINVHAVGRLSGGR
jgi:polyisoprenoid-binding protein YceI